MTRVLMLAGLALVFVGVLAIGPAGASMTECIQYVQLTNDDTAVFSDDFSSKSLDAWSIHTRNISVRPCESARSGYCAYLDRGNSVCDLDTDTPITNARKVELKVGAWLPRAALGETLNHFSLYLRSGVTQSQRPQKPILCVYIEEQQSGGYAISVSLGDLTNGPIKKTSGAEIQPETWTDITLRLDESKGELSILVNDTPRLSLPVNKDYFTSIVSIGLKNSCNVYEIVKPSDPAHPTAVEKLPKVPEQFETPSQDLPTSLQQRGDKAGIYLDDYLITNDGKPVFFDDFQSGGPNNWQTTKQASVKCSLQGCCMLVDPTRTVASVERNVSIQNPGLVEVSAWVWFPPAGEQKKPAVCLVFGIRSGDSNQNVAGGFSLGYTRKNRTLTMSSNQLNETTVDEAKGSSVLAPAKWYRLRFRMDTKNAVATTLVDGQPQTTFRFDPSAFKKISGAWVWSWFSAAPVK